MRLQLLFIVAMSSYYPCQCLRLARENANDPTPECNRSMGLRARAFHNARKTQSSIWLFHITHHAGTCIKLMAEANGWHVPELPNHPCSLKAEELQDRVFFYDSVCGEYGMGGVANFADHFPCSSDKVLMITSMRHPILRIIAEGEGYPDNPNTDDCHTDNYGLRKLLGKDFGEPITRADVELAKARLSAFDIVIDAEKLERAIPFLCGALGWTENCETGEGVVDRAHAAKLVALQHDHPEIYQKWVRRNAPEIEVYEHAKKLWHQFKLREWVWGGVVHKDSKQMPKSLDAFSDISERHTWVCHGNATGGFA